MDQAQPSSTAGKLAGWGAALALAAIVWTMLLPSYDAITYQPTSDEGYYLRYMREIGEKGLGAFPEQFRFYLGDQQHWIFPPPSRVGFIAASALWSKFFGVSFKSLSYLSLASHLAMIVLVFACARRWFETYKAVLVAALVAFSTLYLGLARLALTDSFISLSQVASIWLFFDYVRAPERRWRAIAFGAVWFFALLTKEISVLLTIPFVAHAAIERWYAKRDVPIGKTAAVLVLPGVLCLASWILAAGSVSTLYDVMKIVLLSPATNMYAVQFGSGGWYRYPIDELLMGPAPTMLGIAAVAIALWRWHRGEYGALAVGMALVYVAQIATLSLFTKNLRYIALLEVPLRVLAVVLLWELLAAKRRPAGLVACTAIVAFLCILGWLDYKLYWIQWRTYDPVTVNLIGPRHMVPIRQ